MRALEFEAKPRLKTTQTRAVGTEHSGCRMIAPPRRPRGTAGRSRGSVDTAERTDRSAGESSVVSIPSRGSRFSSARSIPPAGGPGHAEGATILVSTRECLHRRRGRRRPSLRRLGRRRENRSGAKGDIGGLTGDRITRTGGSAGESSIPSILSYASRVPSTRPRPPAGGPGHRPAATTLSSTGESCA
jgi:hypothetical protein